MKDQITRKIPFTYNKRNFTLIILLTILSTLLLIGTVFFYVQRTSTEMTEHSFQRLKEMTENVAREYRETIDTNYNLLQTMAFAFTLVDFSDTEAMTNVFQTFDDRQPYIHLQLLTPDALLFDQSGKWIDVSGQVDFATEASAVPYLSARCTDFLNPDLFVMRQVVPVVKEGKTIAILYGVLSLQEASNTYKVNGFGGNAFILLIDGNTGNVLLDTWHDSLGNLNDYVKRDFMLGDTIPEALKKMSLEQSGDLAFTSQTRGRTIYLHYEPVGVNHLSATIGVLEEVALEASQEIADNLYSMAIIIFLTLLLFTVIVVLFLLHTNRSIYHLNVTDKNTGLLNRNAYKTYLSENSTVPLSVAACIYLDVNGLHELNNQHGHAAGDAMLQAVADALRTQWPDSSIYRIGGDEFVVFPRNPEETACRDTIHAFIHMLKEQGYSVSVGFSRLENETGLDLVVQKADEDMLKNKAAYYACHDCRKSR